MIRASTPMGSGSAMKCGIARLTPTNAQLARSDARGYFQMADSTGAMPNCMGLPAYQNAGIIRIQ